MSRLQTMSESAVISTLEREAVDDFVVLLEITSEESSEVIRLANAAVERFIVDNEELQDEFGTPIYGVVHKGKQFLFVDFQMPLPSSEPNQPPTTSISIDDTSGKIMPVLREMPTTAKVKIIVVHTSDLDIVQEEFIGLHTADYAKSVEDDVIHVSLSGDYGNDSAYPAYSYDPAHFPGMN